MLKRIFKALVPLVLCLTIANIANASMMTSVDSIITSYQSASSGWANSLAKHATSLFWILAFIEFSWAMIGLAFKSNDLGDWASTIINQIMFIGFFYWLLTNSTSISLSIINSFKQAGAEAAGVKGVMPTEIFRIGLNLVTKLLDSLSILKPSDSVAIVLSALVIMVCFGLIAAFSILALVESYVVIYASIIFMGFGGSRWTKEYAIKTLQYAVSVGAKLYVLILLLGIGSKIMLKWVTDLDAGSNIDIMLVVGFSVVMLALVKILPDLAQGLINGTSVSSGGALTAAAASVGGAVLGAASSAVGGAMATKSAGSLASEQLKTAQTNGTAPQSAMGTAGFMAGNMAKNLGGSASENLGSHFRQSTFGGKMASNMDSKTKDMASSRKEAQQDASMESKSTDSQTQSSDAKSKDNSQENTIS